MQFFRNILLVQSEAHPYIHLNSSPRKIQHLYSFIGQETNSPYYGSQWLHKLHSSPFPGAEALRNPTNKEKTHMWTEFFHYLTPTLFLNTRGLLHLGQADVSPGAAVFKIQSAQATIMACGRGGNSKKPSQRLFVHQKPTYNRGSTTASCVKDHENQGSFPPQSLG